MKDANRRSEIKTAYQSGVVTTFTGVMILVLLTLMMFFAIRVGVMEQRVSGNEMRQKQAFHTAEAGINHAKEFIRANVKFVASPNEDVETDGDDGWLAATADRRWEQCSVWAAANGKNLLTGQGTHPCFGESNPAQRANSFYYTHDGSTVLPIDTDGLVDGTTEQVAVEALLCVLDLVPDADVPVQGCVTDPATAVGIGDGTYFMVTLLARGEADCAGGACNAEAMVSEQVSNFGAAAGGRAPNVPLTTKSSFPPSGTAEVVANPNAGGVGVPVSVWMNANASCPNGAVIDPSSGSWATCEMNEWYETEAIPDDVACPGNCSCSSSEALSYTEANNHTYGIDLISDTDFPCDLFQFYFGIPRSEYETVKGYSQILSSCDSLGPDSAGIYWVTGSSCQINSNTKVGSPGAPVMLISAATETRLNGGAEIYGTLFITDVEDSAAELVSTGTNTVYGSVIVDGILGSYNGTFQVVWNENIANKAGTGGGLGSVLGGWSDFHRDWQ
ncbi:MAG: hypothetical protein KJN78_04310 [Gammaproteobacteria bacterium]|nr:hypothetical protein [Gammaproteobacteria bacterium]